MQIIITSLAKTLAVSEQSVVTDKRKLVLEVDFRFAWTARSAGRSEIQEKKLRQLLTDYHSSTVIQWWAGLTLVCS